MKCYKCHTQMMYKKDLHFNGYTLPGWECPKCKEAYYEPEHAQRILLLNKLKKKTLTLKLNKVRSNKIMRIPKEVDEALGFGDKVKVKIQGNVMKIMP